MSDEICNCGGELDGSHDHVTCGPPIPRTPPAYCPGCGAVLTPGGNCPNGWMAGDRRTCLHPPLPPLTETNWERCQRLAREIDKDDLIRQLLTHIARTRRPKRLPLWSFVGEATMHGSGVSCGICAVYGLDSDTGATHPPVPRGRTTDGGAK